MRIFFSLFCLLVSLNLLNQVTAQVKPNAVLVDEFGEIPCEEINARQDQLYIKIQNHPGAKAYVIIHPDKANSVSARKIESYLSGQHIARRHDNNTFQIIHGEAVDNGPLVLFWNVPDGADLPEFKTAEWDFTLSKDEKQFKLTDSDFDVGPCHVGPEFPAFYAYLNANPHTVGSIVIKTKTRNEFEDTKSEIFKHFTEQRGVSPKQLSFFYVNERAYSYSRIEYWLVPGRIKN